MSWRDNIKKQAIYQFEVRQVVRIKKTRAFTEVSKLNFRENKEYYFCSDGEEYSKEELEGLY